MKKHWIALAVGVAVGGIAAYARCKMGGSSQ